MFETFGVGVAYAVPAGGNQPTNKTALKLMGLQEVSFNRTAKLVPLKGSNQYPDAVAVGDKEIKGKAKLARIDVDLWNNIMFGENPGTNATLVSYDEVHSIPASPGPYTVTVTNSATFTQDLGVRYGNGQPFTNMQGGSLTAAGQYNVTAGVYTFFSADAGQTGVTFTYTTSSTLGTFAAEHNQLMGWAPVIKLVLWEPFSTTLNLTAKNGFIFYNVIFGGMNAPIKRDDWVYPELDWEAFPDPNTTINGSNNVVWSIIDGGGTGL